MRKHEMCKEILDEIECSVLTTVTVFLKLIRLLIILPLPREKKDLILGDFLEKIVKSFFYKYL